MKVETEINEGLSFALGCSFRKTKYKNIHITNYDFINKNDLREKDLSILVYIDCGFVNTKFISNSICYFRLHEG